MAGENHHYVPQFILRNFLSDEKKEQVTVYDKVADKTFVTSTRNIMSENRFHDFSFGEDWRVDFEPFASAAEREVLPAYRQVVAERKLDGTPEQKAALSLLVAFQFCRTRTHREQWKAIEESIVKRVESMGGRMQDMKGWEDWSPSTDDAVKRHHLTGVANMLPDFIRLIALKDFVLAAPAPNRSFYLGDHPVAMHNTRTFGPYGNIGLAVPGIEIYLPLSSSLLLCAWCPSILAGFRQVKVENRKEIIGDMVGGRISPSETVRRMKELSKSEQALDVVLDGAVAGTPVPQVSENMDFYNSLQTGYASRYIVCQNADFEIARRFTREKGSAPQGYRLRMG